MSYPKDDGVVSFSITTGMPLIGVYNYVPNPYGPVISARQGYLDVSRQPTTLAKQSTEFSIAVPRPVSSDGGLIIDFSISYSTVKVCRLSSFALSGFSQLLPNTASDTGPAGTHQWYRLVL
jgi:hypothetical protein